MRKHRKSNGIDIYDIIPRVHITPLPEGPSLEDKFSVDMQQSYCSGLSGTDESISQILKQHKNESKKK